MENPKKNDDVNENFWKGSVFSGRKSRIETELNNKTLSSG